MGQRKNKTSEERCQEVYDFFMDFYYRYDLSPDYSEMSEGTGIRRGNLHTYVAQLIKDHKIIKRREGPRGLLPAHVLGSFPLPLHGHIAANSLNPLIQLDLFDSDSTIEVPKHLLPNRVDYRSLYVLKVQGNSMAGAKSLSKNKLNSVMCHAV